MKWIILMCRECGKRTAYLDKEDDNESNYKTCVHHGKHRDLEVIGSEAASDYVVKKCNIKDRNIESLEEIEKIMTEKTGIKEFR